MQWSQAREFIEENFVELGRRQGIHVQVRPPQEARVLLSHGVRGCCYRCTACVLVHVAGRVLGGCDSVTKRYGPSTTLEEVCSVGVC